MDNASLLNDMLNNLRASETTDDELVTIKELYTSCQNLIPTISRLAQDIQNNELLGKCLKNRNRLTVHSYIWAVK